MLSRVQTQRIVKAATSADLLKLVPVLAGVDPSESLVLVAFRGKRTAGALRYGLPPDEVDEDETARRAWVSRVVGLLGRVDGVDGVVPVLYTAATFADHPEAPRRALLIEVAEQCRDAGLVLKDLLCVGGDAWTSVWDVDATADAHPLGELIPDDASGIGAVRRIDTLTRVPEADAAAQDDFADRVEAWLIGDGHPAHVHGLPVDTGFRRRRGRGWASVIDRALDGQDVVPFIEAAFGEHEATAVPCDCRALLAALLCAPVLRDLVMLQAGWGERFGRHVELQTIPTDRVGRFGPTDEATLLAFSGGDFARPDVDRTERVAVLLAEVAGLLPQPDRAPALTTAAWLHWALGHGTAAGALLEAAHGCDPEYGLAEILAIRLARGDLPEWAFRPVPGTAIGRRWVDGGSRR